MLLDMIKPQVQNKLCTQDQYDHGCIIKTVSYYIIPSLHDHNKPEQKKDAKAEHYMTNKQQSVLTTDSICGINFIKIIIHYHVTVQYIDRHCCQIHIYILLIYTNEFMSFFE